MRTTSLPLALLVAGCTVAACTTETLVVRHDPTDPGGGAPDEAETSGAKEDASEASDDGAEAAGDDDDGTESPAEPGSKDAGPKPPPPPPPSNVDEGRVFCGRSGGADIYCSVGQVCCVQNAVKQLAPIALTCDTYQGCQGRPDPVPLTCDGPEDCDPGEHCFALATSSMAIASLCGTAPFSSEWQRLCNPTSSGECEAGQTCVPTTSAPAVGVCR